MRFAGNCSDDGEWDRRGRGVFVVRTSLRALPLMRLLTRQDVRQGVAIHKKALAKILPNTYTLDRYSSQ